MISQRLVNINGINSNSSEKPVFSAEEEASLAEALEKGLKEEAENFRTPPPPPGFHRTKIIIAVAGQF